MNTPQPQLDFFARPGEMTEAGEFAPLFDALPSDVSELVRIVQGLVLYDVVAPDFYGYVVPEERRNEIHLRPVAQILERILALDNRPLTVARPVARRVLGRCRSFVVLLLSMLRAKGVPARARSGFGAYFNPGYFEDHWVCECWDATANRWVLVDPQFDEVWRRKLKIDHDILDVPRQRFLVAAEAWRQCRAGEADPARFGIEFADLRGLWFIAGSLVREAVALNKMEMAPWDVWGAQPQPNESLKAEQLTFFDQLATLTREPDATLTELRRFYKDDDRLRLPATVFNALLQRHESVAEKRVRTSKHGKDTGLAK